MKIERKSTLNYWDNYWNTHQETNSIDITNNKIKNFVNYQFHLFFKDIINDYFNNNQLNQLKLLEIGCASSVWLPYFAKNYQINIYGIDISHKGCELSRQILTKEKINGTIILEDFFNPSESLKNTFDIVISFGLVEHFNPVSAALKQCSHYLKKDGIMITIIPNLKGIYGILQKIIDIHTYNIHVPLNLEEFIRQHNDADLIVIKSKYHIFFNLGLLNIEKLKKFPITFYLFCKIRALLNRFCWFLEMIFPSIFKPNSITSPYLICVSKLKET